ncbi:MAG TPA: DUF4296 domain-containing protein [Ohtaekwangia sp.]
MKVRVISAVLGIWLLSVSCGSNQKAPEGILDHEQMVHALTQVYLTEEKVRRLNLNTTDSSKQVFNRLQEKVFMKEGIQDSILKKSIDYYMDHPLELQAIYTTLVDSLNLMEQRETVKKE